MKRIKPGHFLMKVPIYHVRLLVSFGEDAETIIKVLSNYHCPKSISQPIIEGYIEGAAGYYIDFNNTFYLLVTKNVPIILKDYSTLVHEITHVSQAILENAGIQIRMETTEPLAYLAGYLYEEICKKL